MTTLMPNPLFCPFLTTELVHASATFQPRPKTLFDPSPPPARSRRSEGSSTDTTPTPDADGFIETDLRAGGPKLCESPCETIRKLPTNMKNHDRFRGPGSYQLKTKISDICRDDNVRPDYMEFCGRRSMYEPDCIPIVTLVVVTKRDYPSQTSWTIVSRKLFHYLHRSGITDVSVEIIDEDFEEDPQIHACVPSDTIFPIWKQVAMEIFHNIDCRGVFTIGCFRIGDEDDRLKCPPTILLGVDRSVKRDWKPARDTIVAILDKRRLIDVAVTIHKDNKVARRRGISDREGFAAEDCRKDPNFGTSLSPWDRKDEQGTLGGWVEVQNPENGVWSTFALTCAHCCFPRESAVSPEDRQVVRHWTQQGVRVYDEHKKRLLPIDSPSYRDIKTELDVLANQIEGFESMEQYRRVEELRANDEFVIPSWERDWKNISAAITRRQKERHTIKKFLHDNENGSRLGTVFAASGLREEISTDDPKELSIRDWALVRVDAGRAAGKNIFKSLPKSRVADISKLSEFGSRLPALDEELFKTGRATGHTNATYGNLAICHIATKTVNGKEEYVPTWEHVLLSIRGGDQDPIVDSGDSGSLVFDSIGVVLGMIFGGNGQCNLGYFTATRDLLSDIKHITGVQEIRIQDGIN